MRVRVDLAPYIQAPGRVGETFASTIVDGMCVGGHVYKGGRLVGTRLGDHCETLVAPDGSKIQTGAASSGDLEAAVRASGASFAVRSEEHTSELQSLMRISYAVFCLKKKKYNRA